MRPEAQYVNISFVAVAVVIDHPETTLIVHPHYRDHRCGNAVDLVS